VQNFAAVGCVVPEIFQRHDRVGQRVVAARRSASSVFAWILYFDWPVQLADFVHHPFADGGMGAGNAFLAVVKIALALDFSGFKRGAFRVNAAGQFFRPFDGGLGSTTGRRRRLGARKSPFNFSSARGKIADGRLSARPAARAFL